MTENKDAVESAIDKMKPILSKLTFGGIMGYCSGYAMKKVGKAAAVVVGAGFIVLQGAAYSGYIDVNWGKFKDAAAKKADATGDGKIDGEDVKVWWKKLKDMLTYNIGSSAGFSLGFLTGVKYG